MPTNFKLTRGKLVAPRHPELVGAVVLIVGTVSPPGASVGVLLVGMT